MKKNKTTKCTYSECLLPDDNAKFFIQTAYLLFSVFFLFKSQENFTFVSVLMYAAPILIDLAYVRMSSYIFRIIRCGFIIYNTAIIIFCILGLSSVILDTGDSFSVVETAVWGANYSISKSELVKPMLVELFVPFSLYVGAPNKGSKKAFKFINKEVLQ